MKLTDWSGNDLNKRIRQEIQVGNIVRVPIMRSGIVQTAYFRVVKHCGGNKFKGRVEDPYYGHLDWFFVRNGDTRLFSSSDVVEIPLDWKGNKNLLKKAQHIAN